MDRKNKLKVIAVRWTDPFSIDEWTDIDFAKSHNSCEIATCGILISEDKDKIIIAGNVDVNFDDISCVMIIPKKYITRRQVVGYVRR